MEGFVACVQRLVPNPDDCVAIKERWSCKGGLLNYLASTWQSREGKVKCQVSLIFNYQFQCLFLFCLFSIFPIWYWIECNLFHLFFFLFIVDV